METRKAKLPDGSLVTWHMFFTDADGDPMALVEMAGGNIRTVHASWVEFQSAQQGVHPTPLTLFGMRVEIANWLKPNQWFIRPSRRG